MAPSADPNKVTENRLRSTAQRRGLRLIKSRRRDPLAIGFGTYMLVDAVTGHPVAGDVDGGAGLSLEQVGEALQG